MSSPAHPVPPEIDRLQRAALVAGAIGVAACAVGLILDPGQFFRSWLLGYLFWAGMTIGCLSIVMIHHLTGGMWGLVIRRLLEAGTRTLPVVLLAFLPILAGLRHVYPWADPARAASDAKIRHVLEAKGFYLNVPFFVGRAVFYFAVWAVLAWFLSKWSLDLDAGDDRSARRLRGLSGGGLVLLGLTITFSAVDWAMSLDPEWFSTIYGILFMVGQALSALCLAIVMLWLLSAEKPLAVVLRRDTLHDLGKLLFAFVMLWAYVNVSQFIIVWSGNIPEEVPWYLHRLHGGWQAVALALVVFHFVLPFLVLLSRDLKRKPRLLATVAGLLLVLRLVDLFWLVGPELHAHASPLHWLDVAAPIGLGGLWLAFFFRQLKQRPLLPVGEIEIRDLLEETRSGGLLSAEAGFTPAEGGTR